MKKYIRNLMLLLLVAAAALALVSKLRGAKAPAPVHPSFEQGGIPAASGVLLVNDSHALPEDYDPGELVNLYEQTRHFQLASSEIYLERETFEAANRMFEQAEKDGVEGFIITSGYRSAEKQAAVFADQQDGTASKPGHSEHQTGLAFDVTARRNFGGFEGTKQFKWLSEHCWDYGFILRYPQSREEITGLPDEPWHYRYVGMEIAKIIHENQWTLEEYAQTAADP